MRQFLATLVLLPLLVSSLARAADALPAITQIDAEVGKKAQWLKEAAACPASLLPKHVSTDYLSGDVCKLNPGLCLLKCEAGNGGACYWLAYSVQQGGGKVATSEALFQRACKLGIVSGCTNRAAGMEAAAPGDPAAQRCAVRTFQKTCAHEEPWGCTMYALHLARGMGVPANPDLALKALEKSCRYGKDDPACSNGTALKQEILRRKQASGK